MTSNETYCPIYVLAMWEKLDRDDETRTSPNRANKACRVLLREFGAVRRCRASSSYTFTRVAHLSGSLCRKGGRTDGYVHKDKLDELLGAFTSGDCQQCDCVAHYWMPLHLNPIQRTSSNIMCGKWQRLRCCLTATTVQGHESFNIYTVNNWQY